MIINFIKKIPGALWCADIFNSIIIIIKYSIGVNVETQDERADPNDPEWVNNPWAIVFKKRSDYAKKYSIDKDVLDLCCGTGWTTNEIGTVCKSVVGVDYSERTIQSASNKYIDHKISFIKMNALSLKFPDKYFDTVVSMEAIEHFTEDDGQKFISQAYRVLKKGGIFIGSTPETENQNPIKLRALRKIDPFHLFLYSKSMLESSLSRYFNNVQVIPQKEGWLLFIAEK